MAEEWRNDRRGASSIIPSLLLNLHGENFSRDCPVSHENERILGRSLMHTRRAYAKSGNKIAWKPGGSEGGEGRPLVGAEVPDRSCITQVRVPGNSATRLMNNP